MELLLTRYICILWGGEIKRGVGEIVVLEVISRWRISGQGGKCCIFGRGRCRREEADSKPRELKYIDEKKEIEEQMKIA